MRETSVIVGLVSIHLQIASQQQIGHSRKFIHRKAQQTARVNQEKEEDGGENGEAIPKMRILSTISGEMLGGAH